MAKSKKRMHSLLYKPLPQVQSVNSLHVFQEVIQNAEDAKATKVVFLIDHTTYGKNAELLYDPRLAAYQVGLLYRLTIHVCQCSTLVFVAKPYSLIDCVISARCNIYILFLCYDVSVCLSVHLSICL